MLLSEGDGFLVNCVSVLLIRVAVEASLTSVSSFTPGPSAGDYSVTGSVVAFSCKHA